MGEMARLVALTVLAMVIGCGISYVQQGAVSAEETAIADAGNTLCPVTGDPVDGKNFYEYRGKRYGLCCTMCKAIFANDPEKYAAIADKEIAGKK